MSLSIAELIEKREENHPQNLEQAQKQLLAQLEGNESGEVLTDLSQVYFWLGEYADGNAAKEPFYNQGVEYGKKAVVLAPDLAAAHLWYCANMGAHSVIKGIMASMFYLGPMENHGKKAVALDESYFHGAPLRFLGRFYHQAPPMPMGPGDGGKAIELLEKAVKHGPDFLQNYVYLADAYIMRQKKDEAKKILEKAIKSNGLANMQQYQVAIKKEAERLLAKVS